VSNRKAMRTLTFNGYYRPNSASREKWKRPFPMFYRPS
jgi:hypothetical protein